ncbi:MAG: hypothetical protein OXC61_10210 [Flavobacteriaceae bacterium]|nr:hypothetical protein [Flavobacteriaceae bacterium]
MDNISTNILRDSGKDIDFIATPNSKEIFERIFSNDGTKSFNLIGNYGTGKSTFLWACEKTLLEKVNLFGVEDLKIFNNHYTFIKIIGEEESLLRLFSTSLNIKGRVNTKRLIEILEKKNEIGSKLVIFIDELGKVLEHISKHHLTRELYFLQQLAEWVNGKNDNVYLVTTLHQNFLSYNLDNSLIQKQEWGKIKGRYRDIVFNEPIEQLLFFVSNKMNCYRPSEDERINLNKILRLTNESKLISFNKILSVELVESLYPLDWLSANILVQSLQKYGQNERSLFTFINETSKVSISNNSNRIFNVSKVYDYLITSLSTEINNPYNSHKAQWLSAFRCLERSELIFREDFELATKIIKSILLINLFSKTGGLLDNGFLQDYFLLTGGGGVRSVLEKLQKSGIIRFYNHSNKLNFLEGTDIDIEQELITVGKELNTSVNIPKHLNEFVDLEVVYVKKHSYERGTKRFFEYRIIESLEMTFNDIEGIDGYINIVAFDVKSDELIELSNQSLQNIFVSIKNTETIELNINRILRYNLLLEKHSDDKNAIDLIKQEKRYCLEILKQETGENLFENGNEWIINRKVVEILSAKSLYRNLSDLCDFIYPKTPVFDNELINRNVLSPPIITARKKLIHQVLENRSQKDLNYPKDKFPPDKAIYVSLLRETGIHSFNKNQNIYELKEPPPKSNLIKIWTECNQFLESAISSKKPISDLFKKLLSTPFKLKKGFVSYYIPVFLIVKKEDYALFYRGNQFIPFLSSDSLDLIIKNPKDFFIKTYNVKGLNLNLLESYKDLVGVTGEKPTQSTFITIYGNFLKFIRGLDKYTLNTSKISTTTQNLRSAILDSSDPETSLFDLIPNALGYGNILDNPDEEKLISFTQDIQNSINELRSTYSELLNRIEGYLIKAFNLKGNSIEEYKKELLDQLESIDIDELIPSQKVFYNRLTSGLDDRDSYLKSVSDAIIGYPVEELKDHDESILKDRLISNAEGLLKATNSQSFNRKSKGNKLLQFKFYNSDGSIVDEKIIIKSQVKNKRHLDTLNKGLNGLKIEKKKEILMELYSSLVSDENNE